MKSMKGLSMNKLVGSFKKKTNSDHSAALTPGDTPENTAHNSVKAFIESGGNINSDEVLFLPPIVDAAESSPSAAAECARLIRKYLAKEYSSRSSWQYNSIMLMRILADNPGPTFTRNVDSKFVDVVRYLLKNTKDPSVRQILMETLDDFEKNKFYDEGLKLLIQMWQQEKDRVIKEYGSRGPALPQRPLHMSGPNSFNSNSQNYFSRHHTNLKLPDAPELQSRLEEARSSAKLLEQVVMNTPTVEVLDNELIKEFANRCMSASRSIQGYMVCNDPAPDNDTMESLIEVNEQLQAALSQHQRAILNARKQLGLYERSENPSPAPEQQDLNPANGKDDFQDSHGPAFTPEASGFLEPSGGNGKGKEQQVYSPPPGPPPKSWEADPGRGRAPRNDSPSPMEEDPFRDPQQHGGYGYTGQHSAEEETGHVGGSGGGSAAYTPPRQEHQEHESATMHGAVGSPATAPSGQPTYLHTSGGNVSDDDDIYASTPKIKEPIYRY